LDLFDDAGAKRALEQLRAVELVALGVRVVQAHRSVGQRLGVVDGSLTRTSLLDRATRGGDDTGVRRSGLALGVATVLRRRFVILGRGFGGQVGRRGVGGALSR